MGIMNTTAGWQGIHDTHHDLMFGIYRTTLALMVVVQHLANVHMIGVYAVFGFYMLSGYLMTYIVQQNYGYTFDGIRKYALNRFLRIYPLYWLSVLMALGLIAWVGQDVVRRFHGVMYLPTTWGEITKNVLILFPYQEAPRLTPPAWALTVELVYYVAIGLGLSRTRVLTVVWFAVSVGYHVAATALDMSWNWRYFYIPAASLPFATGAMLYHFRPQLLAAARRVKSLDGVLLAVVVMLFFNWTVMHQSEATKALGFYLNYAINALLMGVLIAMQGMGRHRAIRTLDKKIGDLSYPIYLIHFQVAIVAALLAERYLGITLQSLTPQILLAALCLLLPAAWLLAVLIDKPIERLRDRVKNMVG